MKSHRGFTLAELCVVIAIVLTLASLLLPAIQSIRRNAVRYACLSNLRQVSVALQAYAGDHGGAYPAEGNKGITKKEDSPAWFDRLPAYADGIDARHKHSIFQCAGYAWSAPEVFDNSSPKSLKMNAYLDDNGRPIKYRQGRFRGESEIVLFVDAVGGETGMGQWGHCLHSAVDDSRHAGAVNVLYLDGHGLSAQETPEEDSKTGKPNWKEALLWLPANLKK